MSHVPKYPSSAGVDINDIYSFTKSTLNAYKTVFGESFNVKTESVFIEMVGHIYPYVISSYYDTNKVWDYVNKKTESINIGDDIIAEDGNRIFWDILVD